MIDIKTICKNRNILVTGGAGFIGSNLVEMLLKNDANVTVIDNFSTGHKKNLDEFKDSIEIVRADISVVDSWTDSFKGCDTVFHLAALADIVPSIVNPISYYQSNVTGTLNVLEAAKINKVNKIIYSASSSCYGIPNKFPTPEDSTLNPQYPYALTKLLGEEIFLHWMKLYNMNGCSMRFFNVYGPKSRTSGTYGAVFGVFLAQKLSGKPLTVVGDGQQTRDFTFVSDVCDALIRSIDHGKNGEIYNVGSGTTVSVMRIVELLDHEFVKIPKRPGEPDSTFADISKIKKDLSWKPEIDIEKGVSILLDKIDYWKDAPVWEPDSIKEQTKDWFKYLS